MSTPKDLKDLKNIFHSYDNYAKSKGYNFQVFLIVNLIMLN